MEAQRVGVGGFRGLNDRGCSGFTMGPALSHGEGAAPDLEDFNRALLELAGGEPELVIVDARVLRLLMPGLANLLILKRVEMGAGRLAIGEEVFAWDEPC